MNQSIIKSVYPERDVYTVSQLNQETRLLLEGHFSQVWIEGELSNLAKPASGHIYFSLKDSNAQVRCAMFRTKNLLLDFNPKDGMQVVLRARVSLYEGRGDYQLIVDAMEETGDGALQKAFKKLQQKLLQQGLFSEDHKQPIPIYPKQLGVITSSTGAALRDILSVLKRRYPLLPVIVYPTQVQGKDAAGQIVHAIEIANQRNECDVLIITRGGGSLEDLWPFNEEIVAHAIYASKIPMVSGVGHEIDFTIADFVADQRAATPSAAAELISPDQQDLQNNLQRISQRLTAQMIQSIHLHAQHLKHLSKRLQHPGRRIEQQLQRLDELGLRLHGLIINKLKQAALKLREVTRTLDAVSPLATLQRGYAIVRDAKGNIINNTKKTKVDDEIKTQLATGSFTSVVTSID